MKKPLILLFSACLLIIGCDDPTGAATAKTEELWATPFDTQINALEKAKEFEGQMQQDEEARRKQMEQATQ